MKIKERVFLGRNGIEVRDEMKKIFITNELGGRILYYGTEEFNILHENEFTETISVEDIKSENLKGERNNLGWNDFGGYKTWLAPQSAWDGPPYLDLDRATYDMDWKILDNGNIKVTQISPICRETGIELQREILIYRMSTKIEIKHIITSTLEKSCSWGIWDVTQVKKPCISFIKGELTQYEQFGESSCQKDFLKINDNDIVANCPANEKRGYKGYFLSDNNGFKTIFELGNSTIEYLKEFKTDMTKTYAHNSNIEIYSDCNKNYAELEVHSPLFNFAKIGESNYFVINWAFKTI